MGFYSDRIFPAFYDYVVKHKPMNEHRARILREASGEILEIGIGTGINLEFYPKHIKKITAIDPSSGMAAQLQEKIKKFSIDVNFVLAGAEKLPFADNSFDTIVSGLTLCTIPDLKSAFAEFHRVLKPDGKFIFMDHGLSPDPGIARLQKILNPLQHVIGCGCSLTVDIVGELQKGGFKIEKLERYYVGSLPKFVGSMYEGVAVQSSI